MYLIQSPFDNAYENLALEEYLLRFTSNEYLLLYINKPSIVIGKHQNAYAEANFLLLTYHSIPLVRRITGGGTVYHDEGNLNISIIRNTNRIDFSQLLLPLKNAIDKLNLVAEITKKNDIFINGRKVTGTAAHIFKNRSIHHGTLLINASLSQLKSLLKVNMGFFVIDHAVESNPSPVTNLMDEMDSMQDFNYLTEHIKNTFISEYFVRETYTINDKDYLEIRKHVQKKYATWEWNFGYSPDFSFFAEIPELSSKIFCTIKKGMVKSMFINSMVHQVNVQDYLNQPFDKVLLELIKNYY